LLDKLYVIPCCPPFLTHTPFSARLAAAAAVYVDELLPEQLQKVPQGMAVVNQSNIMSTYAGGKQPANAFGFRGTVLFLDLYNRYPDADWYVGVDDDTYMGEWVGHAAVSRAVHRYEWISCVVTCIGPCHGLQLHWLTSAEHSQQCITESVGNKRMHP
jgi:hypothetical protein